MLNSADVYEAICAHVESSLSAYTIRRADLSEDIAGSVSHPQYPYLLFDGGGPIEPVYTYTDGQTHHTGIFQISYVDAKNSGNIRAQRAFDAVYAAFDPSTFHLFGTGFQVYARKPPNLGPIIITDVMTRPITIYYTAYQT